MIRLSNRNLSIAVNTLIFLQGVINAMAFYYSEGFYFFDEASESFKQVTELYSSGSDDNIVFVGWALVDIFFLIPLLFMKNVRARFFVLILYFFSSAVWYLSLEVGSVDNTIMMGNLYCLFSTMLFMLTLVMFIIHAVRISSK